MIELRRLHVTDWADWRALRLAALADAPAGWQGDNDVPQRWRNRLTDVPFNLIAELDGRPAGMVSGSTDGNGSGSGNVSDSGEAGEAELLSMWVAPFARGRGVGDALVTAVLDWARPAPVRLRVAADNARAVALYTRHGFLDAGAPADASGMHPGAERLMRRSTTHVPDRPDVDTLER